MKHFIPATLLLSLVLGCKRPPQRSDLDSLVHTSLVETVDVYSGTVIHKDLSAPSRYFTTPYEDINPSSSTYGQSLTLGSILDQHSRVLVNVWEPWCSPCLNEMPLLEEIYGGGAYVVGLSADYKGVPRIQDHDVLSQITFPLVASSTLGGFLHNAFNREEDQLDQYPSSGLYVNGNLVKVYYGELTQKEKKEIVEN